MNRYAAFVGSYYYPAGGWDDFVGSFATLEEAKARIETEDDGMWAHVIDLTTCERVADGDRDYGESWKWGVV